jgi:hypothetical protein
MDCYIYFKALAEHEAQVTHEVYVLQQDLQQHGIKGSLQRRPEIEKKLEGNVACGLHTWMEVYRQIPDNFSQLIADCLSQRPALRQLITGDRHMEFFITVDMPASPVTAASTAPFASFA